MEINKIIKIFGWLTVIILSLHSCNTMEPIPTDNYTDATFWRSASNADQVVNMAYSQMYSADKMWSDEALSDNIFEGRRNTDQRIIRNGIANPELALFENEWKSAYEGLKTCHIFLANIERVPDVDLQWLARRTAEVRFIRAFIYFRLVNFYGDIPFFTTDISLEESYNKERTAKADVLQFIRQELTEITPHLMKKEELSNEDKGRITKGAAIALQARTYLYESDWHQTINYCDSLINYHEVYGEYSLFSDYSGLFQASNEYNEEVILDYAYVPSLKTWSKYYDAAPLSAGARVNDYAPVQSLVDNYLTLDGKSVSEDPDYNEDNPYEDRDPRLQATIVVDGGEWVDFDGSKRTIYTKPGRGNSETEKMDEFKGTSANSSPTGYYMKKYYDPTATQVFESGLNIIMFRYADILLMYAEAKNEVGELDSQIWETTIKALRERAGFTTQEALAYPSNLSEEEIRQIIRQERRSELALEGLRYFDIIRWKEGKDYLEGTVYGAKFANNNTEYIKLDERRFDENRDYLWSLPRQQIDLNKNLLPNNPGYAN